jgi:hypothetical protein
MNGFKLAFLLIMIALSCHSFTATAKGIIDSVNDQGVIRDWACVAG